MKDKETLKKQTSQRFWKIAASITVLCAIASMSLLGYLLIHAGSSKVASDVKACIDDYSASANSKPKCPPKNTSFVDGLVKDATDTGFDLVTSSGEKKSYKVRPADRPYIDIQHAQTHASLGQPVRIYIKKIDGEKVIVYMTDPPLGDGTFVTHG